MAIQRRWGLALLTALCVAAGAYAAASRLGYLEPLRNRFLPRARASIRLSAGDFPAGVSAPVGDIASIPLRAARVGFSPRGSSVALLLATGGVRSSALDAKEHFFEGLLKSGYAMDAKAVVFGREEELRQALAAGAESGGVDVAALSVDRLAQWADSLRDAAPRTVLMLGRSRGQDALARRPLSSGRQVGFADLISRGRRSASRGEGRCGRWFDRGRRAGRTRSGRKGARHQRRRSPFDRHRSGDSRRVRSPLPGCDPKDDSRDFGWSLERRKGPQ